MEMNFHPARAGVAGAGLGLGIAGTALSVLNGGLGNILGGGWGCGRAPDGVPATRHDLDMQREIVAKDSHIALLESNIYTDSKIADVYERLNAKVSCIESQISAQAVYNATNSATLGCLNAQVAQLMALTKTVIPITNVCPEPMARYNSWTAPTAPTTAG